MSDIESSLVRTERALAAHPDDALLLHYRAYALYRAGSTAMDASEVERARPYLASARAILEPLVMSTTIPESYALLASVYGLQIATARVQMLAGMQLGSRATEWMNRAVAAGPTNPRVWLLRGIGAFNTPSALGGGLDKAEAYLTKSLVLMATDSPDPPLPGWGRADAHLWLGQVYARQNNPDAARAEFRRAQALQPRNPWISKVLLQSVGEQR